MVCVSTHGKLKFSLVETAYETSLALLFATIKTTDCYRTGSYSGLVTQSYVVLYRSCLWCTQCNIFCSFVKLFRNSLLLVMLPWLQVWNPFHTRRDKIIYGKHIIIY